MSKQAGTHRRIKTAVAVLAVLNLVAVIVFQYDFSFIMRVKAPSGEVSSQSDTAEDEKNSENGFYFSFDSDTLTYNGSGKLNLMDGVKVLDNSGEVVDVKIFAEINGTKNESEKTVVYSADTADGQISEERTLLLENYAGVVLSIPDDFPEMSSVELDGIAQQLSGKEDFYASDGYGNDLTDQITVKHQPDQNDPKKENVTFSVTNMFGDTVSKEISVNVKAVPVLILSAEEITLHVGDSFKPLSVVETAMDIDGVTSLYTNISLEGDELDTSTPGIYRMEYVTYSLIDKSRASADLTVKVVKK